MTPQVLAALRATARTTSGTRISSSISILNPRTFSSIHRPSPLFTSTSSPIRHPTSVYSLLKTNPILTTPQCLHRTLSLSRVKDWLPYKPPQTLPPAVAAEIEDLQTDSNATPHDVSKQLALFTKVADTKTIFGYQLIVTRWERMYTFDSSSPLLRSDRAFEMYVSSLIALGLDDSAKSAARRRDSLLESTVATTARHSDASLLTSDASHTGTASPTTATTGAKSDPDITVPPLSRSQEIAQAVMSGTVATSSLPPSAQGTPSSNMAPPPAGPGGAAGNPLHVSINQSRFSNLWSFARMVVICIVGYFVIMSTVVVLLDTSGLRAGPRPSEYETQQNQKTVKFSDVHGVDEVKEELKDLVEFLKDPAIFATLGGKLPKGVLLTGPPGTGKTMLARAVAGEAGVPFLFASGSDFEEMYVGVGAKRVRDLFATARKKQPAIIFIDELDAVGGKRNNKDSQFMKQTLNQLLVEMDGFLQTEGVVVIAATNFPESLDPALTRPGRFDKVIAVPLPDIRGRVQILQHYMRDVIASQEADPTILARGTAGFSGAELENLVNQAAIQASKEAYNEIMLKHFEWAKDRIIMGNERKSAYIDDKAKLMTAYHEGGHAIVSLYTEGAMPLHKVTCVPRGHALGYTSMLPLADQVSTSLQEYRASIDVSMGGRVAEAIVYGANNVTSGASSDLKNATNTATAMVKKFGFSQKVGPVYYSDNEDTIAPQTKETIDAEVRNILLAGEERVFALLKSKEHELHRLARALVEHETLDADQVRKVINEESIENIKELITSDLAPLSTDLASPSTESVNLVES